MTSVPKAVDGKLAAYRSNGHLASVGGSRQGREAVMGAHDAAQVGLQDREVVGIQLQMEALPLRETRIVVHLSHNRESISAIEAETSEFNVIVGRIGACAVLIPKRPRDHGSIGGVELDDGEVPGPFRELALKIDVGGNVEVPIAGHEGGLFVLIGSGTVPDIVIQGYPVAFDKIPVLVIVEKRRAFIGGIGMKFPDHPVCAIRSLMGIGCAHILCPGPFQLQAVIQFDNQSSRIRPASQETSPVECLSDLSTR